MVLFETSTFISLSFRRNLFKHWGQSQELKKITTKTRRSAGFQPADKMSALRVHHAPVAKRPWQFLVY